MKKVNIILTLTLLGNINLMAQSPGGIDGCELWLVTTPVGSNANGPFRLTDMSGDSAVVLRGGAPMSAQPRDSVQTFNFQPALRLPTTGLPLSVTLHPARLPQVTVMGVFAPVMTAVNDTIGKLWGIQGRDTITKRKCWSGDPAAALRVHTWQRALRPVHTIWDEMPGSILNLGGSGSLDGWCPELLVWGRTLTPYERVRAESYLALKYGITLEGSYYLGDRLAWSKDTTWHRVTGIFADSTGIVGKSNATTSYEEAPRYAILPANDSHQGRNSNAGCSSNRLLMMGTAAVNTAEPGYLIWGDNNKTISTTPSGDNWHITQRRWLVSEAGGLGDSVRAELSYAIDSVFRPYRHTRSFLLAKGGGGDVRPYRCEGFDPNRSKILFNNVSLADGDTVCFAWNDGLEAAVSAVEASCNGTTPLSDGKILTDITCGGPVTPYTLSLGNNVVRTGCIKLGGDTISGLAPGSYMLEISQPNGKSIYCNPSPYADLTCYPVPDRCDFVWQHGFLTSGYDAGIRPSGYSTRNNDVTFGFHVSNNQATPVINGMEIDHYTQNLSPETEMRISLYDNSVNLYVGGAQVLGTQTYSNYSNPEFYTFFFGESVLCNTSGIPSGTCSSDHVIIDTCVAVTHSYEVHIGSACGGATYVIPLYDGPVRDLPPNPSSSVPTTDSRLTAKPTAGGTLGIEVYLEDTAAGPVQILVFDAAGRLHREGRVIASPPYRDTFSVSAPGVYIVKALTADGEHSCKVACGTP